MTNNIESNTNFPFSVNVKAGEKYFWCSCGLSKKQPFCDGSHKGTGLKSVLFEAKEDGVVKFCGCKKSNNSAICDGSHNKISNTN